MCIEERILAISGYRLRCSWTLMCDLLAGGMSCIVVGRFVMPMVFNLVLMRSHLLKSVPAGDGAQGALHMGINDLKCVDVGCVDPAESEMVVSTTL